VTTDQIRDYFALVDEYRRSNTVSPSEDSELRQLYSRFNGDTKKYAAATIQYNTMRRPNDSVGGWMDGRILAHCNTHVPGYETKDDQKRFKAHLQKIAAAYPAPSAAPAGDAAESAAASSPAKKKAATRRSKK
jgi:hypothetical protein